MRTFALKPCIGFSRVFGVHVAKWVQDGAILLLYLIAGTIATCYSSAPNPVTSTLEPLLIASAPACVESLA